MRCLVRLKTYFAVFITTALVSPVFALAALPIQNLPQLPYEPLPIDSEITVMQAYLGDLVGDPHMYEFTLGEASELSLTLLQEAAANPVPFSLIVVKVNDFNRGVKELGRIDGQTVNWSPYVDEGLALELVAAETYTTTLEPGFYRFEVSTADNSGKYVVVVGNQAPDKSYWQRVQEVYTIHNFFDRPVLLMLFSPYVYWPLFIILVLILSYLTWRYRERIVNPETHG